MATAATNTRPNFNNGPIGFGGVQRNLFGNPASGNDTTRVRGNEGGLGNTVPNNTYTGNRVRNTGKDNERRELSGDEIEDADEIIVPPNKRPKITEETWEVPAQFFGQIVGMLEGFRTKGTIWYNSPEAEKKRDKSSFVLWKGRTKNDGTMTLSIMDSNGIIREVVATEVSIAQQFKDIFDPNSASRIFELVGNGTNIQKAVFQTLNEQNEGSGTE